MTALRDQRQSERGLAKHKMWIVGDQRTKSCRCRPPSIKCTQSLNATISIVRTQLHRHLHPSLQSSPAERGVGGASSSWWNGNTSKFVNILKQITFKVHWIAVEWRSSRRSSRRRWMWNGWCRLAQVMAAAAVAPRESHCQRLLDTRIILVVLLCCLARLTIDRRPWSGVRGVCVGLLIGCSFHPWPSTYLWTP